MVQSHTHHQPSRDWLAQAMISPEGEEVKMASPVPAYGDQISFVYWERGMRELHTGHSRESLEILKLEVFERKNRIDGSGCKPQGRRRHLLGK